MLTKCTGCSEVQTVATSLKTVTSGEFCILKQMTGISGLNVMHSQ